MQLCRRIVAGKRTVKIARRVNTQHSGSTLWQDSAWRHGFGDAKARTQINQSGIHAAVAEIFHAIDCYIVIFVSRRHTSKSIHMQNLQGTPLVQNDVAEAISEQLIESGTEFFLG